MFDQCNGLFDLCSIFLHYYRLPIIVILKMATIFNAKYSNLFGINSRFIAQIYSVFSLSFDFKVNLSHYLFIYLFNTKEKKMSSLRRQIVFRLCGVVVVSMLYSQNVRLKRWTVMAKGKKNRNRIPNTYTGRVICLENNMFASVIRFIFLLLTMSFALSSFFSVTILVQVKTNAKS